LDEVCVVMPATAHAGCERQNSSDNDRGFHQPSFRAKLVLRTANDQKQRESGRQGAR
jgi:hypothetical protein